MSKQLDDETIAKYKKAGLLPKDRLSVSVDVPKLDNAMQLIALSVAESRKLMVEMVKPKLTKPEQWRFDIHRDIDGAIITILATKNA